MFNLTQNKINQNQKLVFANYGQECHIFAQGMDSGIIKYLVEEVEWGYRYIKNRHTYLNDRKLFLYRLFRTANLTLWQKSRQDQSTYTASMVVALLSKPAIWIGNIGELQIYLWQNQKLIQLNFDNHKQGPDIADILGKKRYGIKPQIFHYSFGVNDAVLIVPPEIFSELSNPVFSNLIKEANDVAKKSEKPFNQILLHTVKTIFPDHINSIGYIFRDNLNQ